MIDTHCHLDVDRFDADRTLVLERAWRAGLEGLLIPAIGPDRWEALLEWPARDPRVQVALGIHPQLLPELDPADDEKHLAHLSALLERRQAVAIGECGLDGPSEAGAPMARQVEIFRAHLELARRHGLPVLVHCLRAHPHLERIFKEMPPLPEGLVLHSYSGSKELVKGYVKRGCRFSFAGPVTFAGARRPIEALREVPEELLLAETDAPDQAPDPHRGQRSEPAFLPLIIDAMARARGCSAEHLRARTTQNARALFARRRPVEETRA